MATNYKRPGVSVDQNITQTPTSLNREHPAFVFGPNYELHRYEDGDEKPTILVDKPYTGQPMAFKYPGAIDAERVDRGYTKLTGDNVVVKLVDLGAATLPEQNVSKAQRAVNGGYTKLLFKDKIYVDRDTNNNGVERDDILPKNLAVGDLLVVSYKETGTDSTEAFIQTKIGAVEYHASDFDMDESPFEMDSSLEGKAGTLVVIKDAIPETVDLDTVKVVLAEKFQAVEFTRKNLLAKSGFQWEQPVTSDGKAELIDDDGFRYFGVKVNALNVEVSGYFEKPTFCEVLFADLYVTYRELITSYSDTLHSVLSSSEVANMLGKVHPDNPLAQGVYNAAINAATDDGDEAPPIYFMAVPTDNVDGYDAVLNRATLTDLPYVLAPVTRDEAVLEKVRSHCLEMSVKTVKQWRIAFVSAEVPETQAKLSRLLDPQGDDFLAIPVSDDGIEVVPGRKYNKFRIVKSTTNTNGNSDTAFRSPLDIGDTVKFDIYRKNGWGENAPYEYTVTKIVNNYTVEVNGEIDVTLLTAASENANYVPLPIEIYHTFTSDQMADEVAKVSKAMASRRMYNVFPSIFKNDGVEMTGEFAACAVAGLVSATEPQQPITNVTVRGIDDIPLVYQQYNRAQLDVMAAGGTFIIAQDLPNDLVYVRHQISTAYPDGNLNTAELSVTKNVDNISYKFAQVFRPYFGRYNIVPGLLGILRNKAEDLLDELGRDDSVYGPQLILDETKILDISQNQVMKDNVNIKIKLGVPYPCNNIEIELIV
jgi:hypothetical protein